MSGKPAMRAFGEVESASPATLAALKDTLPDGAGRIEAGRLVIDHEGGYFDAEDFLETAALLLAPGEGGNLDVFDDDERRLTRVELANATHNSKTYRYDDILEHTKGEGNW